MKNILILCTGNSCRSQIAHGYFDMIFKGKANIYSAGIETHGLNENAVKIIITQIIPAKYLNWGTKLPEMLNIIIGPIIKKNKIKSSFLNFIFLLIKKNGVIAINKRIFLSKEYIIFKLEMKLLKK